MEHEKGNRGVTEIKQGVHRCVVVGGNHALL